MAVKYPISRIETVFRRLMRHVRGMRETGEPVLSVAEVDRLVGKIRKISPGHPSLEICPWGWRVGPTYEHPELCGQVIPRIPAVYRSASELPKPVEGDSLIITPKFEGVSVVCHYRKGILLQCSAQMDGRCGWDVTNNVISRIPLVIRPYSQRRERFTGYIQCVATVNAKEFFRKFPKVTAYVTDNPLKETISNLLWAKTDVPRSSCYIKIIPVNIYHSGEGQFVRVGSMGWRGYTQDFKDQLQYRKVEFSSRCDLGLTERTASELAGPHPHNGLVARMYNEDLVFKKIFVYKLKGDVMSHQTTVVETKWFTSDSGRLDPMIFCTPVDVDGRFVESVWGQSHQFIAANKISAGAKLEIVRKPGGQVVVQNVARGANPFNPNVRCQFGCDPEFIEIDTVHAYCRNPRCPGTTLNMLDKLCYIFAPQFFNKETRRKILDYFHNNIFEFIDFYKNMEDLSGFSAKIDGVKGLDHYSWIKYGRMLERVLKWELTLPQLCYLAGIESMGGTQADLISRRASSDKELTEWAKETSALPRDWGIKPRASENWARRHYMVKEILKSFKLRKDGKSGKVA